MIGRDGVLLNVMEISINPVEFEKRFAVIRVSCPADRPDVRRDVVNLLRAYDNLLKSIKYGRNQGDLYAVCNRVPELANAVNVLNSRTSDGDVAKIVHTRDLEKWVIDDLINISMNDHGLPFEDEENHFSNIEGSLYLLDSNDDDKAVALKVRYGKAEENVFGDTVVHINAQTFCNIKLKGRMRCKWIDRYPRYVIDKVRGILRLAPSEELISNSKEASEKYVCHGADGIENASVDFFSFKTLEKLDCSKMGRLNKLFRRTRREFGDIVEKWEPVRTHVFDGDENWFHADYGHIQAFKKTILPEICRGKRYLIIDKVGNGESVIVRDSFIRDVKKIFDIQFEVATEPQSDALNVVIVRTAHNDPDYAPNGEFPVQHVAVESYREYYLKESNKNKAEDSITKKVTPAITTVMLNLILKSDVQSGTQSFFEWTKDAFEKGHIGIEKDKQLKNCPKDIFDREWRFMNRALVENLDPSKKKPAVRGDMAVLTVQKDGSFTYSTIHEGESMDVIEKICWKQFDTKKSIHGVLTDGDNIYSFLDTDMFLMPDVDRIREKLKSNPKRENGMYKTDGLRANHAQDYLMACTDLRRYVDPRTGDCYYFVGENNGADLTNIHFAANLHVIKLVEGTEPVPDEVIKMMLVPYVRLMRYTITPYPFKYLHEYERMEGLDRNLPKEDKENLGEETRKSVQQMTLDFEFL